MRQTRIFSLLVLLAGATSLFAQDQPLRSAPTKDLVRVTWQNRTSKTVYLRWVNFEGQTVGLDQTPTGDAHPITAGAEFTGATHVGHVFDFDGKKYMIPDSADVSPPFAGHTAEQRIALNIASRARDTRYRFDWLRNINDSLRIRYECLNREAGGYGSVWKKVRRENGKTKTTYFTEVARTPEYIMLRDPVTKRTVKLRQKGAESGIDEVAPGAKTWTQSLGGNWYAPR